MIDILVSFDENTANLEKLLNDKKRLKVSELLVWKEKADDIIGVELDSFVEFLMSTYMKKTTLFSFTMKSLREAMVSWAKYENLWRHGGLDAATTGIDTETVNDAMSIY